MKVFLVQNRKLWLYKFKLVKLLFFSIKESLPSIASDKIIDLIFRTEAVIAREIDTLIVEFMLKQTLEDVVEKGRF